MCAFGGMVMASGNSSCRDSMAWRLDLCCEKHVSHLFLGLSWLPHPHLCSFSQTPFAQPDENVAASIGADSSIASEGSYYNRFAQVGCVEAFCVLVKLAVRELPLRSAHFVSKARQLSAHLR